MYLIFQFVCHKALDTKTMPTTVDGTENVKNKNCNREEDISFSWVPVLCITDKGFTQITDGTHPIEYI